MCSCSFQGSFVFRSLCRVLFCKFARRRVVLSSVSIQLPRHPTVLDGSASEPGIYFGEHPKNLNKQNPKNLNKTPLSDENRILNGHKPFSKIVTREVLTDRQPATAWHSSSLRRAMVERCRLSCFAVAVGWWLQWFVVLSVLVA